MEKFEYLNEVILVGFDHVANRYPTLEKQLNEFGSQGWEVIYIDLEKPSRDKNWQGNHIIFKRRIKE